MNIFFTGATGFIGRATVAYLQGEGHSVKALVRHTTKARDLLGQGVELFPHNISLEQLSNVLGNCDAVVNLAGNPIATRWTKRKKASFRASRVNTTKNIIEAIEKCGTPPKVFISASAVGYYGNRDSEVLTEESQKGEGFLSELCEEWENTALQAQQNGTRVCTLRTGIVLGREGGILQALAPLFEMNLGSYIGSKHYVPWIHITDMVEIIGRCINDDSLQGPINCTSPFPVTNKEFASALKHATNSRLLIKVPSFIVRPFLGEASAMLTSSQNALPKRLETNQFEFRFPQLANALAAEFTHENVTIENYQRDHNDTDTLEAKFGVAKRGQYQLTTQVLLRQDSKKIFEFFSSPLNLGLLTPTWVDFRILDRPDKIESGSYIQYRIGLWFLGFKWLSQIIRWEPNNIFIDMQEKGPYRFWWHEHSLIGNNDNSIIMQDRVIYRMPFGAIGRLMHKLFVRKTLLRIFNFRRQIIQLRFS